MPYTVWPCETLHVEGFAGENVERFTAFFQKRRSGQLYAFDVSEGIFIAEADCILHSLVINDTYWFDEGLEWIVYASHHNTFTFAGEWLLQAIRKIFREQPDRLNPWWLAPKSNN